MGQVSYETYASKKESSSNQNQGVRVGFFSLQNDKDEAVVRIMHDSTEDFDIMVVHPTTINGKFRKVNCIRDSKEPLENCPFCQAQKPVQQRIFIHLLEYVKQEDGTVMPVPKIWERSTAYITTLKNYIDEYGPLSDNIFKIKRNGEKGSMDTTYDIIYANPNVYRQDIYVKDEEAASKIKALGTAVLDKDFNELSQLILDETGGSQAYEKPVSESPVNYQSAPTTSSFNTSDEQSMVRPIRRY